MKEKIKELFDKMLKNGKYVFPVIAGIAVAVTVIIAMTVSGAKKDKMEQLNGETISEEETPNEEEKQEIKDIPLVVNSDTEIQELIVHYFDALAKGDREALLGLCDVIEEDKMLEITELAKYVDHYTDLEIYTKPGYEEGATIAYVCYKMVFTGKEAGYPGYRTLYVNTSLDGKKTLKFQLNDNENEYIIAVSSQADVVDMNNRVAVEYNDLMSADPELLRYLSEVHNEVQIAMGVAYGQQEETGNTEVTEPEEDPEQNQEEPPVEDVPIYATVNATVNVRSSDSVQADKLGKVSNGTKLQVLEQLVNGWSKVVYEGKDAYIKSEFLVLTESAAGAEVIGTVTAESNVNVRVAPGESAERLGVLTGGDSADLLGKENGWCKINYNGKVGYVKEDFVQ